MIAQRPFCIAETALEHQVSIHFHSPQSFLFLYEEKFAFYKITQIIAFVCFQQKFSPASDVLLMWFLQDTHKIKSTWLLWSQREKYTDFKRVRMSKHSTGDQTTEARRKSGKKPCAFTCHLINIWWQVLRPWKIQFCKHWFSQTSPYLGQSHHSQSVFICEVKVHFIPIHICTMEGCENPKHRTFPEGQSI